MKKVVLYPLAVTAIIIVVIACNWCITAFLALVLETTRENVACSPIIVLYIISLFGIIFLSTKACEEIDCKL